VADDSPVAIQQPETIIPTLNTRSVLVLGGVWGQVGAGQTWLATDGARLVWSADGLLVIYSIKNQFFAQTARGFRGEVTTYPLVEAARHAATMARLAEVEMKLLMGVVAGASGVGWALVVGMEALQFAVENREKFERWKRQLQAALDVRDFLKQHSPTLYEKVFNAVLKQLYKDVKGQLPEAVTAEVIADAVGRVIGAFGKLAAEGKFSTLRVLFAVLRAIAGRVGFSVVPGAFLLTADEYSRMAAEIVGKLREVGVALVDGDVRKIVEEVRQHPAEIRSAFQKLQEVFGKEKE
jgi:hypothetical protein